MRRETLWTLLIFCLLTALLPIGKGEKYIDYLTEAEKVKIDQLWAAGVLHKDNIDHFLARFVLAPNRDTAIEHAFNMSWFAEVQRYLVSLKNIPGLLKAHYGEHGFFKGTWRITKTVVLVPFRAWHEIFAGNKGLGPNPFKTLCGAASLIIVILLIADWHFIWLG